MNRTRTTPGDPPGDDLIDELSRIPAADGAPLMVLRRRRVAGPARRPAVLLVHGIAMNRRFWDLPGRSFQTYLARAGFDTYNVELRGHGLSRAAGSAHPESLEAYIDHDVPAVIDAILARRDVAQLHYVGHSLGAMIGYAQEPRRMNRLASFVSLAGPYAFADGSPALRGAAVVGHRLARAPGLRGVLGTPVAADRGVRWVHRLFLELDRVGMDPPIWWWAPRTIERPLLSAVMRESFDRTSLEIFAHLAEMGARRRFASRGGARDHAVAIEKFRAPMLFITGGRDRLVSPGAVRPAYERAKSARKEFLVLGPPDQRWAFGHLDLVVGRHAPVEVWPRVLAWLDEHAPKPKRRREA